MSRPLPSPPAAPLANRASRTGAAGQQQCRSSAGRGLHPRPERSTPAKYLLEFSLSTFCCRCSKSSPRRCRSSKSPDRRCRSSTMPVGGCTPDRNDPPPPNICLSSQTPGTLPPPNTHLRFRIRPPLPCKNLPISLASPMLLRGWIVPVGDAIPDRHKAGTLPLCWLRGVQPPTGTKSERSPFAGCGMLIIKYRLGASVRICFCRSATMPVGDCIPDRNAPPPPNIHLRFRIRQPLPSPTPPISLAPPMLLRV